MKRAIKSSSLKAEANNNAKVILNRAKALFDALENTSSGFIRNNSLSALYDELSETIMDLDFAIKSGTVEI